LVGNDAVHEDAANETFLTDNEVATKAPLSEPAATSKRSACWSLNLVAAVGLEPTTYGL